MNMTPRCGIDSCSVLCGLVRPTLASLGMSMLAIAWLLFGSQTGLLSEQVLQAEELADPVVAATLRIALGADTGDYAERGFKDIVLGTTFEEINKKSPLRADFQQPWCFRRADEEGENFLVFDDDGILRLIAREYSGGPDDYLQPIIELFGKTDKPIRDESSRDSKSVVTRSVIDYTFAKVLVQVKFVKGVLAFRQQERTYIHVLDREWAEDVLATDVAVQHRGAKFLRDALKLARIHDWDAGKAPTPKGLQAVGGENCVLLKSPTISVAGKSDGKDGESEAGSDGKVVASYGMTTLGAPVPFVEFNFAAYDTQERPVLLRVPKNSGTSAPKAIDVTPLLSYFALRCASTLMQIHFPPTGDTVSWVWDKGNRHVPGYYEWSHKDELENRWLVRVFSNNSVSLILVAPKKSL
jgi:hypothetical protein